MWLLLWRFSSMAQMPEPRTRSGRHRCTWHREADMWNSHWPFSSTARTRMPGTRTSRRRWTWQREADMWNSHWPFSSTARMQMRRTRTSRHRCTWHREVGMWNSHWHFSSTARTRMPGTRTSRRRGTWQREADIWRSFTRFLTRFLILTVPGLHHSREYGGGERDLREKIVNYRQAYLRRETTRNCHSMRIPGSNVRCTLLYYPYSISSDSFRHDIR